jgi:putative transposase
MLKRYKYRAYPTPEQAEHFQKTFGCSRVVYNNYVQTNKSAKKTVSYKEACANLTLLKKKPEYSWLKDVSSIALQQSLKDANKGVNNFFLNKKKGGKRKVGLPTYKKRSNKQAYRIVGENSYKVVKLNNNWSSVVLPKLSTPLKFKQERELPSTPTSVTIIREATGHYYVSFVVEVAQTPLPITDKEAAGDAGLTTLLTIVNNKGEVSKIANPRFLNKAEAGLKKAQRNFSRTQKGSKNREKRRIIVARKYARVTNQKKDLYNKVSVMLFRENQTISMETLNIAGMVKNHKLAKSISSASWGLLLNIMKNHAAQYGRELTLIDQWYASSHVCFDCKIKRTTKLSLSEREWACEACGVIHDRDTNAALNILFEGNKLRTAGRAGLACGENISHDIVQFSVKQELHNAFDQVNWFNTLETLTLVVRETS